MLKDTNFTIMAYIQNQLYPNLTVLLTVYSIYLHISLQYTSEILKINNLS